VSRLLSPGDFSTFQLKFEDRMEKLLEQCFAGTTHFCRKVFHFRQAIFDSKDCRFVVNVHAGLEFNRWQNRSIDRQGLLERDTGNLYLTPKAVDASDEDAYSLDTGNEVNQNEVMKYLNMLK
jgi:hypothetical protein